MGTYYQAYERRYRRVYEQGIPFWTAFPDEVATVKAYIDTFWAYYGLAVEAAVLDCGCGEGYLAEHFVGKGYSYTGIDCSQAAIDKARGRITSDAAAFEVGDITRMPMFSDDCFDAAVDVYCMQMLVTDPDRRAYLSQVRRVLRPGGRFFFLQITQPRRFEGTVETFEEYMTRFEPDYETDEPREAYVNGETKTIHLNRVPSRFDSPEGYRDELANAGFQVDSVQEVEMGCVVFCCLKEL